MVFWRISNHHDLSGRGGEKAEARWNEVGLPVVYLADSAAGALLEVLVHTTADAVPPTFTLLKVTGSDVAVQSIERTELPAHWTSDETVTRPLGASWLEGLGSALLLVPSVIAPETWNALLNPRHPEAAEFRIERVYEYPFDLRLKG